MSAPSPPSAPLASPKKKEKRRSFFGFQRRSKTDPTAPPPSAFQPPPPAPSAPDALIPVQWSPNRLATLYVTPSERNLYLAAISQLDQAPPPLPLWTDPAPVLPSLNANSTSYTSSPVRTVTLPSSPKLVTSPNLPSRGLQVRDEFRTTSSRRGQHALLGLSAPGSLKFTGFPVAALAAIDEAITIHWKEGVRGRSESLQNLQARGTELVRWRIDLEGKVWRKQGGAEVLPIRLLLAIFTALGKHGWSAVNNVSAASSKTDLHNLLFIYSPDAQALPPAFFALSIPLPDRICLISPPPKSTPALIGAVRSGIVHNTTPRSSTPGAEQNVDWHRWNGGIKEEGWVDDGVYRFFLGGMRRWLGGGVKSHVVENVHPQLFLSIINALTAAHFQLVTSVPLLPTTKGRDILIFASLPSSGVSHRDTYVPQPYAADLELEGSPVLVSREEAPSQDLGRLPITSEFYAPRPHPTDPDPPPTPQVEASAPLTPVPAAPHRAEPRGVRRTPSNGSTASTRKGNVLVKKSSIRRRTSSGGSAAHTAAKEGLGPAASQAARRRRRDSDEGGTRPIAKREESWEMISPNSLGISAHRRGGGGVLEHGEPGVPPRPEGRGRRESRPTGGIFPASPVAPGAFRGIDPPSRIDTPGTLLQEEQLYVLQIANPSVSAPAPAPVAATPLTAAQLIAQEHARLAHPAPAAPMTRDSPSRTSSSGNSIYHDAPDARDVSGPASARDAATEQNTAGEASTRVPVAPLPLGGKDAEEAHLSSLRSPAYPVRGRTNIVDVGQGVGVPSMVASVGFTPSTMSGGVSDIGPSRGSPGPSTLWNWGKQAEQVQQAAGSSRTKVNLG